MSPVPRLRDHLPHVRFLQGNVLYQQPSQWVTEEGKTFLPGDSAIFDFAFSRLLIAGMTDWPRYISKVYQMLKPGGWAKLQEMRPHVYDANDGVLADAEWYTTLTAYQKSKGLDVYVVDRIPDIVTEAGFQDIQIKKYRLPLELGADAGDKKQAAARWFAEDVREIMALEMSRATDDMGVEVVRQWQESMKQDLASAKGREIRHIVVSGRKLAF